MAFAARGWTLWRNPTGQALPAEGDHAVRRVIDGDTFVLESGVRIRLQGVNTPELAHGIQPDEPYALEARARTERFVQNASGIVHLTYSDERLDRYGRTLAFAWNGRECLNEILVREGMAQARLDYRFSGTMRPRLQKAQQAAREEKLGIWSR